MRAPTETTFSCTFLREALTEKLHRDGLIDSGLAVSGLDISVNGEYRPFNVVRATVEWAEASSFASPRHRPISGSAGVDMSGATKPQHPRPQLRLASVDGELIDG